MARFAVGQAIRSVEPTIVVDAGLPAGAHRFQLEVIDSTGRRSGTNAIGARIWQT